MIIRKIITSIGNELTRQGVLKEAEEIFHLTIDEIFLLIKEKETAINKDWQRIIKKRINIYNKNSKITPPYLIKNNTLHRIQGNMKKKSFKATGISQGKSIGQVRIISTMKDLSKVKNGEIAVVSTFHPSWTPILGLVNGLVMNYGNILSHGAVVAREYRIPVVVFNDMATNAFTNGQWIEVNGSTGRIRILDDFE